MTFLKRIRGAIGIGITWAAGWAVAGFLIGLSSNLFPSLPWDRFFEVFDAPLVMLSLPGFVGGVIFSIVLGIAARRKKFDELSIPRFAAWGAIGGLLLSMVPAALVGAGLASADGRHGLLEVTAMIGAPLVILSAISASLSLVISRRAQDRGPETTDTDELRNLPLEQQSELLSRTQEDRAGRTRYRV
jgi:hypothetical protein